MDLDDALRQAGERWRARHSGPVDMPDFDQAAAVRAHRRPPGLAVAVAVAAVVVLIVAAAVTLSRTLGTPPPPATPSSHSPTAASSPSPSQSSTGSASATPSRPAVSASRCTGAQLSARIGRAGPAAGTENILIALRNTSRKPCHLGGILPLVGVRADGTTASLTTRKTPIPSDQFYGSTDPGYADPGPVTGPGTVKPGKYGGFMVTEGLNNCPKPFKRTGFTALRIGLGRGQYVEMPWPQQLSLGCPNTEAPAGPVPSPTSH